MSYKVIHVKGISDGGYDISAATAHDDWFKQIIEDAVDIDASTLTATLTARVARQDHSIEIVGGVYLSASMACNLCLVEFDYQQEIPFRFLLEPLPKGKAGKAIEDEKQEDINDSLDFSYYSSDEIDLGDLIRQHITMAQPISYTCSESCRGLCPKCGKNLNIESCECGAESDENPFSTLKGFKPRSA